MIVVLDPLSPVPPYEQVRSQFEAAIESMQLGVEERLPTVRKLAGDLGIAANTVARAYRELEAAGLVDTRGRYGTFVARSSTESREGAIRATRDFAETMRKLGIGPSEVLAMLRRELEGGRDTGVQANTSNGSSQTPLA